MADDQLNIVIRTRGGREAAAQAKRLAQEYRDLGYNVKRVTATVSENTTKQRDQTKATLAQQRALERQQAAGRRALEQQRASTLAFAKGATAAATLAAAYGTLRAAASGFSFNAEMETNRISFEFFLKSAELAKKQMKDLMRLGQQMPAVGQAAFATSAKQLLAFGLAGEKVTPMLAAVGAAVNASGKGPEGLANATRSLGQILATGKVQGDELNELANWGVYARKYLTEAGLAKPGKDIGMQNIKAEPALAAIQAGLQRDYGGLTAKTNKTWANQVAAAKQYATQASAALVKPMQDWLQSNVLPKLGKQLQSVTVWLQAGGADKLWKTLKITAMVLAPLITLWGIHTAAVTLAAARIVFLNFVINVARGALVLLRGAILVATAAQWLWNAAMTANPIGLIIVGIAALIGIIVLVVKHWDKVKAVFMSVWDWLSDHPWALIFAGPLGPMIALATQVIKYWDKIKATITSVWAAVEPIVMKMFNALKKIVEWSPLGVAKKAGKALGIDIPFMAAGGNLRTGGTAVVGEAGPELLEHKGDSVKVTPLGQGGGGGGSRVLQPLYLMVNGKVFADVMVDVGQTAAARR